MNNALDTARRGIIREEILNICSMAGIGGADTKVIRAMVKKNGYDVSEEDIVRHAKYLKEKGLVSVRDVGNERLGIKRTVVSITAPGTDYLEGSTADIPGIGG